MDRLARRLEARERRVIEMAGFRAAAVLLLLGEAAGETYATFIVRPAAMRSHSGQIALPGGVRDPEDESLVACALREAEEELGIPPAGVRVLGMLDDVPTPTGFVITPVVAELVARVAYRPNPDEVSEVFDAPVRTFADPDAAEYLGRREAWGVVYHMRAYRHAGHRIWGATARVLENLIEVLSDPTDG